MILHIWICFLKVFYGMQTPYLKVQLVSISFRAFFMMKLLMRMRFLLKRLSS